ncbi:MAG: ABC transporter substrate-binding protein [Rhodospirillales bacterium]|nr:ABC transporter substrate-binding protein [Rhodospirillales bacterium]
MIQWRGPTETDRGFTEYFAQEGIAAEFIVRNADRNPNAIPEFVREIKQTHPDLVYTWGGAAPPLVVGRYDAVDPERHVVDIPVVTCMVADPVELGVVPSWESSGRNVTGTSHVAPLEVQLRAMQAYGPLQHLAIIYNTTEPGPGVVLKKLRQLSGSFGFWLSAWPVPLDRDGKPRPDALPALVHKVAEAKPDFLYLGPDSFLGAHRAAVTEAALKENVPTFVSSEIYLKEAEGLAGIVSRYYNMGQFCAYKAEQILVGGKRPQDIPFQTLKRFTYMIRSDAAHEVDYYPPIALLNMAELIRQ